MASHDLKPFERFRGTRGLVMGLGVFGGGVESAKFLCEYCDSVVVTDLRGEEVLAESVKQLEGLPIDYRLGEHRKKDFIDADVVIHSPAVRPDNQFLQAARNNGAEVTMEMSLFIEACPAVTVGITGSNGKTTTALLAYEMLCEVMERAQPELEGKWAEPTEPRPQGSGKMGSGADSETAAPLWSRLRSVWLGGNCGQPLLNRIGEMSKKDVVVLELSSFQLQDWHRIRRSCNFGLITNITPNHLDWHRDFDEYKWAKSAVAMYPTDEEVEAAPGLIEPFGYVNADDEVCRALPGSFDFFSIKLPADGRRDPDEKKQAYVEASGKNGELVIAPPFTWSEDDLELGPEVLGKHERGLLVARRDDLRLPGDFNWANAVSAALMSALVGGLGVMEKCGDALRRFRGVEHRLEYCGEVNGARCYNDSIATTPESTMAALSAFDSGVHLLLGGSDKGLSCDELAKRIADHPGIKGIYVQGDNADSIRAAVMGAQRAAPLDMYGSFDDACAAAFAALEPGDVFLMSPSSASFYEYAPNKRFTNFEHRGRYFKSLVQAHAIKDS